MFNHFGRNGCKTNQKPKSLDFHICFFARPPLLASRGWDIGSSQEEISYWELPEGKSLIGNPFKENLLLGAPLKVNLLLGAPFKGIWGHDQAKKETERKASLTETLLVGETPLKENLLLGGTVIHRKRQRGKLPLKRNFFYWGGVS